MQYTTMGAQASPIQPTLPELFLPSNGFTRITECAANCFAGMAAHGDYFYRDGLLVKARTPDTEGVSLEVIDLHELPSQMEYVFTVMRRRKTWDGNIVDEKVNCAAGVAKSILSCSDELRKHGLPLRLLAARPVLIDVGGKPVTLRRGYHREEGGIYVVHDCDVAKMTIEEAKELLLDLFADYIFVSPSDQSRAMAQILSPSLKIGNLLGESDYPLDVGLADKSQGGKTHRMRFSAQVYGETAFTIARARGGVGSIDEAIAQAILSGNSSFCATI